jgi:hypothetical protein
MQAADFFISKKTVYSIIHVLMNLRRFDGDFESYHNGTRGTVLWGTTVDRR